jgi:hypothetical protein
MASARLSHPQHDWAAQPSRPLTAPNRPWDARGSPCAAARAHPRDCGHERRERRGRPAALHAAGGARRHARTPTAPADAVIPAPAADMRAQQPGAATTAQPATPTASAAVSAALSGGGLVTASTPAGARQAGRMCKAGSGRNSGAACGRHGRVSAG